MGLVADGEIEEHSDDGSLIVIRDGLFQRSAKGPVGPGFIAGLRKTLVKMPGSILIGGNVVLQCMKNLVGTRNTRPIQQDIFIIDGKSFRDPQEIRAVFPLVIEWAQFNRPDAFYIVAVKIFMGNKAQHSPPAVFRLEIFPVEAQRAGVSVFDPATAVADGEKDIMIIRNIADEGRPGLHYFLKVSIESGLIKIAETDPGESMRDTPDAERRQGFQRAHQDGFIV